MTRDARIVLVACLAGVTAGCAASATEEGPVGEAPAAVAHDQSCGVSSTAQYLDCDEFAGVGTVPLANVVGRVPSGYTVVEPFPGAAIVVAQGARCAAISVGGNWAAPGMFAQFGIAVAPPTGTGDGNFYQLMFATDHACLASQLARLGVADARFDPSLDFQFSAAPALSASVSLPPSLAWGLGGPVTLPDPASTPNPVTTFNYWKQTPQNGNVLQQNVVTGIRFGEGDGVTLTAVGTDLQAIVGGTTLSFPFFAKPETFDRADVSLQTSVFP